MADFNSFKRKLD